MDPAGCSCVLFRTMNTRFRPLLLCFCSLLPAVSLWAASPVDELLGRLGQCDGATPIKVRVTHSYSRVNGEGAEARTDGAQVTLLANANAGGLTLSWDAEQLKGDDGEAADPTPKSTTGTDAGPKPAPPLKRKVGAISTQKVAEYMNVAAPFAGRLKDAVLIEEKTDSFEGKTARLLVLKLDPHLKPQDKKYIKQLDAEARIWLDSDGFPLAAEASMSLKGRAFLVITFEQAEKETYRFARVGQRLVVTSHQKQGGGSGAGEKGTSTEATTLEIL